MLFLTTEAQRHRERRRGIVWVPQSQPILKRKDALDSIPAETGS